MEKGTRSFFSEKLLEYRSVEGKRIILSFSITFTIMILEIIGGFFSNSIALISDAGHMFTHCFALALSYFAIHLARKPPCHHRTFGLFRAEVLAAFINGLFLLVMVGIIIYESIERILSPAEVNSIYMIGIALIGLFVNISSILILHANKHSDLNIRSVFFHMIADAASSVGIVIVSIIIMFTGWYVLDPIIGFGISLLILVWALGVLKESTRILLEMAPEGLNVDAISNELVKNFGEITDLHNVHLWTITPEMLIFSAHIIIDESKISCLNRGELISKIAEFLKNEYSIIESTIQVVTGEESRFCTI